MHNILPETIYEFGGPLPRSVIVEAGDRATVSRICIWFSVGALLLDSVAASGIINTCYALALSLQCPQFVARAEPDRAYT